MSRVRRILVPFVISLAVLYISFAAFIWWAMHQTPEIFGAVMARMPQPAVFLLLPFEALWMQSRAGNLKVGDSAPDFSLAKIGHSGRIQLSELNRQHPVVLVFGSYT